jgi:hypothetical protein
MMDVCMHGIILLPSSLLVVGSDSFYSTFKQLKLYIVWQMINVRRHDACTMMAPSYESQLIQNKIFIL